MKRRPVRASKLFDRRSLLPCLRPVGMGLLPMDRTSTAANAWAARPFRRKSRRGHQPVP
jgi:hypothetical protein